MADGSPPSSSPAAKGSFIVTHGFFGGGPSINDGGAGGSLFKHPLGTLSLAREGELLCEAGLATFCEEFRGGAGHVECEFGGAGLCGAGGFDPSGAAGLCGAAGGGGFDPGGAALGAGLCGAAGGFDPGAAVADPAGAAADLCGAASCFADLTGPGGAARRGAPAGPDGVARPVTPGFGTDGACAFGISDM